MHKIVIDNKYLQLVSRCIDKAASGAKFINIFSNGEDFVNINCCYNEKCITISSKLPAHVNSKFSISVDKDKFIKMIKNFYDGEVLVECKNNKVNFKSGNIKVSLIQVEHFESSIEINDDMICVGESDSKKIIESINKCVNISIGNSFKDMGLFIDSSEKYTRIGRLGHYAVRIISFDKMFDGDIINISTDTAKIVSDLSDYDNICFAFDNNNLIMEIQNQVRISMAKIVSSMPVNYLEYFKLLNDECMVDFSIYNKYKFDKVSLLGISKIINDVLSKSEPYLRWDLVGTDDDTGYPVWNIYGISYEGEEVSEIIRCMDNGDIINKKFSVNSKSFVSAIKLFDNSLFILDNIDLPIVICNENGNDVVILAKANM